LQVFEFLAACFGGSFQASFLLYKCLLDPVQLMFLLVERSFTPSQFILSLGHELLLRHCDVRAA
jgi:hypothetical protein